MTDQKELIYNGRRLPEYFRSIVKKAIVNRHVDVSETGEFYLVNLLNDFQKCDRLYVYRENHYDEEPLAMLLAKAMESDLPVKIKSLKRLGDMALYTAGFFEDHIGKHMVDLDYYVAMGGGAYLSLSGILSDNKTFSGLYSELSAKFRDFVKVFNEISISQGAHSNMDILRLYERWLKTRDERIRRVLEEEGVACRDPAGKTS